MSLTDRINEDIKKAMLAREKDKLEALRAVKSALLIALTSEGGAKVTEQDEIKLLQKLVKQRREAATIYTEQQRTDLAEVENSQAEVIAAYLPEQMSREEIVRRIEAIVINTGATSIKDMGKVMAVAGEQLAGKADNKTLAAIIKEALGAK
ncbi:MAG: GatB/YqeY domain-containing protein [Lentimicrobium sp.]|jgi:uncharacterized protein YqeY|nr:GatB/YqeY domain-containing protein [Lentimicrobium sp.]